MKITLFSTDCPKCMVLESKLKSKGIDFEVNKNVDEMLALGMKEAPALHVTYNFSEAIKWVNGYKE